MKNRANGKWGRSNKGWVQSGMVPGSPPARSTAANPAPGTSPKGEVATIPKPKISLFANSISN